jgi:glycosyltransferase involved in cell wall biosynthesis
MGGPEDLYVVVPFYNEERWIEGLLESLAVQSDLQFVIVLVDNGSSDATGERIADFRQRHPAMPLYLIHEPRKGTGAASDTGFRWAIAHGAQYIARTDADCLLHRDWICNIKRAFIEDRLEFIAGKVKARDDDLRLTIQDRLLVPLLVRAAELSGRLRRRGQQFRYPYVMASGNNMAITAELYERSGGFNRTSIIEDKSDLALSEVVRTLTDRGAMRKDVIAYNSIRRLRSWGYVNTLRWYWNRSYKPAEVDVR